MITNDKDEWFVEGGLPYAEQDIQISVRTTKTLFDEHGPYGHIQIFDTPFFGRILVIDGIINISDRTEFIYHEMMVTLPSIQHGNPKSVLIIGGGDGGAAKHALRIQGVERIVQVEVDKMVVDSCREFMPTLAEGSLDDPKVELIIGDGIEYVKNSKERFDVIVLDVSDPVEGGPAENILSADFYSDVKSRLNKGGVMLTHCGSLIFQARKSETIANRLKSLFSDVTMHIALIPEFELTEFGFLVCSDTNHDIDQEEITNRYEKLLTSECKFLSPEVYSSSKVLSPYITKLSGISNK